MNSMMKTSVAIGAFVAMGIFSSGANAACNVVQSGLTSHTETDCASANNLNNLQTQVDGIQIDAFHATDDVGGESNHSQAIAIGNQSTAAGFGSRVGLLVPSVPDSCATAGNVVNAGQCYGAADVGFTTPIAGDFVAGTPERIDPVNNGTALGAGSVVEHNGSTAVGAGSKSTDTDQVTLGTAKDTVLAEGITSQTSKDRQQGPLEVVTSDAGGRLATDGGQIFSTLGTHNDQIAALHGLTASHGAAISAHAALLSEHTAKLEEHSKGLAIAMAMPDLWLSDKERFSIAGNLGGFGDETAIGFGAIARIDQTWSLNAKFGSDVEFEEFGWTVGARAGF